MKAIIVGNNRAEECEVKERDNDKTFFAHRRQLYMMMPGNLVRMRYYDAEGREIREPEELSIFPEGSSVAYDTLMEDAYYQEAVLPAIDLFRDVKAGKARGAGMLRGAATAIRQIYPFAGLLVTLAVVGYALIAGG